MPASYSSFSYEALKELGIRVIEQALSFEGCEDVAPSEFLKTQLERNLRQRLRSEKAKSEFLIAPVLAEIKENNVDTIGFFSGYNFDVDKKKGLKGFCDFLFSLDPLSVSIEAPVFCVVEAKNDNLDAGAPQCIAEMYAAQLLNQMNGKEIEQIYGATTFGYQWKFYHLVGNTATIDTKVYALSELPQLLGIFQFIIARSLTK